MPSPPPARSLNRQSILDEDDYTSALSHIIARDFFPSLVHLDATNDYLDSLRSADPALIAQSVRRLEALQTPSQTPYGFGASDTPRGPMGAETPRGEPPAKRARLNPALGLDAFQAQYTSEDNASFSEILDDENRARREKYGWAWAAQRRVEEQRDRMIEGRERMLLEAPREPGVRERRLIEPAVPRALITAGEEGEEKGEESKDKGEGKEVALVTRPQDDEGEVDVMAPKKDTRPAGVDGWKFKVCKQSRSARNDNANIMTRLGIL